MDQLSNPYAPPKAESSAYPPIVGSGEGLRRDGGLVVIPVNGARFPDRCVVCNQTAVKRLQRKLYWHTPVLYFLICAGILIYAIAAIVVRKRAHFEIGLCQAHVERRRNGILIGWIGFFASLVGLIAVADRAPAFIFVFVLAMIAFPVAGIIMTQVVAAKRIDNVNAWLKVGRPFLESL
jgi:hypothetical protein